MEELLIQDLSYDHRYKCIHPADCIYIGDHKKDLEAGINAGTNIIACYFGYSLKPSDQNKNILGAHHPSELYDLICQI